jgi:hypothetical protein
LAGEEDELKLADLFSTFALLIFIASIFIASILQVF